MIFACRIPHTPAALYSRTDGLDMKVSTRQKQGATRHNGAGAKGDNSASGAPGGPLLPRGSGRNPGLPVFTRQAQPTSNLPSISLARRSRTAHSVSARPVPNVLAARDSACSRFTPHFPSTKLRLGSRFCLKKPTRDGISSIARILLRRRVEPVNPRSDCYYQNHIRIRGRITWKLLLAYLVRVNARKKL